MLKHKNSDCKKLTKTRGLMLTDLWQLWTLQPNGKSSSLRNLLHNRQASIVHHLRSQLRVQAPLRASCALLLE
jgi:hypothetical protein